MILESAYERPCYRALDTPLRILGLEVADWFLLVVVFVICLFGTVLLGISLLLALPLVLWGALVKVRKGKRPAGYLKYLAYKSGLVLLLWRIFPEFIRGSFLIPPLWGPNQGHRIYLSVSPVRGKTRDCFMKFYLNGQRWIGFGGKAAAASSRA